MNGNVRSDIQKAIEGMANQALRTIVIAYKEVDN